MLQENARKNFKKLFCDEKARRCRAGPLRVWNSKANSTGV